MEFVGVKLTVGLFRNPSRVTEQPGAFQKVFKEIFWLRQIFEQKDRNFVAFIFFTEPHKN